MIRGRGYLKSIDDLGNIVLKTDRGTPVLLRDVSRVELGPDERRGITELNGEGEVASGIVLQRFGMPSASGLTRAVTETIEAESGAGENSFITRRCSSQSPREWPFPAIRGR